MHQNTWEDIKKRFSVGHFTIGKKNMELRKYSVIIIGSGFGAQCAAISLTKKGILDFLMLERRDFIGRT